ncbi:MAG: hypothetical protein INF91_08295 [Alphaproteobacteria bacterium]|nr:hypothetical protein [Alphaproteobacteria bacterium]
MERIGGGILIAIGLIVGAGIGIAYRQPSLGVVGGLVAGSIAALAVTIWDSRRKR